MERREILKEVKKFFEPQELVCDHVFEKWGKNSWRFLDTDFLWCLLVIRRDIIKRSMYVNGNNAHQRGLRCNMCQLVKEKKVPYLSTHIMGKACDVTIPSMSAEEARQLIIANKDLLPCPIRIERDVNWLHFDVGTDDISLDKVTLFKG